MGYGIYKINDAALYGPVMPHANYSPWNCDTAFKQCMTAIRGHTLVDTYRCHELWSLVRELRHVPGDILEVGVWRGGTGALLASKAQQEGIAATVWLCDTFVGVVKASERDPSYFGGEHADTSGELVEHLLARMDLTNARILQGIFPDETASAVTDATFRLCHIDVDVYQSGRDILEWLWPRLAVGGAVVWDDYGGDSTPGITRLVEEQRDRPDRVTLHNLNGHAVTIRTR